MIDVTRALGEKQFASIEEANAYLQEMLTSGGVPQRRPASPLEEAQDLMYDAWEAEGPRRVELARKALAVSPDCADAYVLLAEEMAPGPAEALMLYARGVAAAERALGKEAFDEDAGHFWGKIETRPYMRARFGLAQGLWALGRRQEAIEHYWELLRLNPGDNQGVRYLLLSALLAVGDQTGVKELLDRFPDDLAAIWVYGRALSGFAQHGDTRATRALLAKATKANPHVPAYLLGQRRLPRDLPEYVGIGDEREAIACAHEQLAAWQKTPGALAWLGQHGGKPEPGEPEPREPRLDPARLGYRFFLNPHEDCAFTRCPECDQMTKVRKLYLVVHVEPQVMLVLNKSCRLCEGCNLLIVKKWELESLMAHAAEQRDPSVIGNEYLVLGTLERSDGRRVRDEGMPPDWVVERMKFMREQVTFEPARWGWYPDEEAD